MYASEDDDLMEARERDLMRDPEFLEFGVRAAAYDEHWGDAPVCARPLTMAGYLADELEARMARRGPVAVVAAKQEEAA